MTGYFLQVGPFSYLVAAAIMCVALLVAWQYKLTDPHSCAIAMGRRPKTRLPVMPTRRKPNRLSPTPSSLAASAIWSSVSGRIPNPNRFPSHRRIGSHDFSPRYFRQEVHPRFRPPRNHLNTRAQGHSPRSSHLSSECQWRIPRRRQINGKVGEENRRGLAHG